MSEPTIYFDRRTDDPEAACPYCRGLGKRLHDRERDGGGMAPAGPYRCRDCDGSGFRPERDPNRQTRPVWTDE